MRRLSGGAESARTSRRARAPLHRHSLHCHQASPAKASWRWRRRQPGTQQVCMSKEFPSPQDRSCPRRRRPAYAPELPISLAVDTLTPDAADSRLSAAEVPLSAVPERCGDDGEPAFGGPMYSSDGSRRRSVDRPRAAGAFSYCASI
jgi:hypothetical protein